MVSGGVILFVAGLAIGALIVMFFDALKECTRVRQEYLDSLSDSEYRKYKQFLLKLNYGIESKRKYKEDK